jgi:nitric oxide reductase NorD protein
VRAAASRLGHEIGQMRLPFQAGSYVVHAAYRDDGSWLWEPQEAQPADDVQGAPPPAQEVRLYPEWDQRIGRYRGDWCRVHTCKAPLSPVRALPRAAAPGWPGLTGTSPRLAGRAAWGDEFHAMGLVDARVQRRAGQAPDAQVYRRRSVAPPPLAVLLLVDASASAAPLLGGWLAQALAGAGALEAAGHACALLAFSSWTRERVEVRPLKHWHEGAAAPVVLARCRGLASGGSTRLGAALRHAVAEAAGRRGRRPVVLVFSDGEAHDVDAPAAYLQADLGRALAEAARAGVLVRGMGGPGFLQSGP